MSSTPSRARTVNATKTTFLCLAVAALAGGCASTIEGAAEPPSHWELKTSGNCQELSGDYAALGHPAPANAHASAYLALWPAEGSLLSILQRGVNGSGGNAESVRIRITGPASMKFLVVDTRGGTQELSPHEWRCQGGELVGQSLLSRLNPPQDSDSIEESVVRLWKSADGALIAENSIDHAKFHADGPATRRRTVTRFYFRFAPVSNAARTP
jgi:hypothetical protein